MIFFKTAVILVMILFVSSGSIQAEENYTELKCTVSFKKPEYKEGKAINFEIYCTHESDDVINLPEQFVTQSNILAKALRFTNADGQELCLMDKRYSTEERFYRWVVHNPQEKVTEIAFPDKRLDKYRLISCSERNQLRPEDVLEREDLYRLASGFIPRGEYMVSLDLPFKWQTVQMGYHKLILTESENKKKDVADSHWWSVDNNVAAKPLIIK